MERSPHDIAYIELVKLVHRTLKETVGFDMTSNPLFEMGAERVLNANRKSIAKFIDKLIAEQDDSVDLTTELIIEAFGIKAREFASHLKKELGYTPNEESDSATSLKNILR